MQACVKKYLFRCKIEKFRAYYNKLLTDRAEKIYSVIRKHISCYAAKLAIQNVIFLRYRKERLAQIRENLSILTISNIFTAMKFTFKVIKHRINKYKRKLRNSFMNDVTQNSLVARPLTPSHSSGKLSYNASNQDLQIISSEMIQNPEIEEISSSTSENERIQREAEMKRQELERKERIRNGKISYCIRTKASSPPLLPSLYQKDIVEGISIPSNFYNITRAAASRISESRPRRYTPSLSISRTPTPHIAFKSKRIIGKPIPLYKRETVSSKMNRWDAENEPEEPQFKEIHKPRLDSKLMNATFAYKQKINLKYEEPVYKLPRPSSHFTKKTNYEKKSASSRPRPYSMANSNILFNPI